MSFNNIICNTINGQLAGPCKYRIGILPNTEGGLTISNTQFNIPMTTALIGLGIADNFAVDPQGFISVVGDKITINKSGHYRISCSIAIGSNLLTPDNVVFNQILPYGQAIFNDAPAVFTSITPFISTVGTPISGVFNIISAQTGASNAYLEAGTELAWVCQLLYDTGIITLTSNISIDLISP